MFVVFYKQDSHYKLYLAHFFSLQQFLLDSHRLDILRYLPAISLHSWSFSFPPMPHQTSLAIQIHYIFHQGPKGLVCLKSPLQIPTSKSSASTSSVSSQSVHSAFPTIPHVILHNPQCYMSTSTPVSFQHKDLSCNIQFSTLLDHANNVSGSGQMSLLNSALHIPS